MLRTLIVVIGLFPVAALGAFPEPIPDADLARIKAQIENGQPEEALIELRAFLQKETFEADIFNLMGYAYRKMGNWARSREFYTRALALDPRHKGALEYMGELELQVGDVPAARALLVRLRSACPDSCEELDDLIEAFADRDTPLTKP